VRWGPTTWDGAWLTAKTRVCSINLHPNLVVVRQKVWHK